PPCRPTTRDRDTRSSGRRRKCGQRLAKRSALGLELFAVLAVFVPGLREFAVAIPDFREPGLAIGQQTAPGRPGHANPFPVDSRNRLRNVVITSLNLTDLGSDVAEVR